MDDELTMVFFSCDEYNLILEYQAQSGATTVQNAILNAISLAIDHMDD